MNTEQKHYRHQYVIGDLQGCFGAFNELLSALNFDETQDKLWLAGDIVARGEDSLATLREAKRLSDIDALSTVLGNHDITLIATWRGVLTPKAKDKTLPIFEAPDCDELLNWLRQQPLLVFPDDRTVLTHAGIPPNWSITEAAGYAKELEKQLSGNLKQLDRLLPNLYRKKSEVWSDDLNGHQRMCAIANYFTRMRLCTQSGRLEFSFKKSLKDDMPMDFRPWFSWFAVRERRILFGHWAALNAEVATKFVRALDGGCVWGGKLVAYRLSDGAVISVSDHCS
ncbi:symmetrical bis(5'-nucleosyl)-tetraphosphatase [Moraxella catarrhalis]|uniref:bis(5'-nucleosyl)-tetraphosphatase (symmetrical) n=1 Tax=Moraxella catarrhalis TaxID=480 RepID=A0A3A9M1C1_MORCA|nr:symmetrical bis(5'-nucleosyl)-tetraphosphatase [Moraxella catarrhalis]ADG61296.1 bis(5'-nucleosyl)-tetraphosphatase [Moraxella catarrhalis BBH18]AIK00558.1 apaH [Moraxella catarrhalis]AVL49685.1 symmetrical bis(5'-nucleosyl)-tetraphosphatase [Moraxella catarrhalis]AXT94984.1 diadenosine tetraphosphatase [Moraxella catarrhalis]AZQ88154.1 bis(5'-nucleosyl)-tetraphosphatase [Moraxella catarrhalis]